MLIIILSFIESIAFIVIGYLLAKYLKKNIVDKANIRKQKIEMQKELSE